MNEQHKELRLLFKWAWFYKLMTPFAAALLPMQGPGTGDCPEERSDGG